MSLSDMSMEVSDHHVITTGDPALAVVAFGRGLNEARERAYLGVRTVSFADSRYRNDIAAATDPPVLSIVKAGDVEPFKTGVLPRIELPEFTYLSAGVDTAACEAIVARTAPLTERTRRKGCQGTAAAGGSALGKLCDVKELGCEDPVLVSSNSNVGTKLKAACKAGHLDTIGMDLVALCVNDIVVRGAEPLFFHSH